MPSISRPAIMLLAALCCAPLAYGEESGGAATSPAEPASAGNNSEPPAPQVSRSPEQDNLHPTVITDFDMYSSATRRNSSFSVFLLPRFMDFTTYSTNGHTRTDGPLIGFGYDHIASYMPAPNGLFWMDRYSLVFVGSTRGFKYAYLGVGATQTYGLARSTDGTVSVQIRQPIGGPFFAEGKVALPFGAFVSSPYGTSEYEFALGVGNDNAAFKLGGHDLSTTVRVNGQPREVSRAWVFAGFSLAL